LYNQKHFFSSPGPHGPVRDLFLGRYRGAPTRLVFGDASSAYDMQAISFFLVQMRLCHSHPHFHPCLL
jgi:hypothetical protein